MRTLWAALGMAIVAGLGACAASGENERAAGSDSAFTTALACRAESASFSLASGRGVLAVDGVETTLTCQKTEGSAATCTDGAVTVQIASDGRTAMVTRDGVTDLSLSCAASEEPDAGADAVQPDPDAGPAALTFDDVKPIFTRTCNGCHPSAFTQEGRVFQKRQKLKAVISGGRMPKGNSEWRFTEDGQKVLEYLESIQ